MEEPWLSNLKIPGVELASQDKSQTRVMVLRQVLNIWFKLIGNSISLEELKEMSINGLIYSAHSQIYLGGWVRANISIEVLLWWARQQVKNITSQPG